MGLPLPPTASGSSGSRRRSQLALQMWAGDASPFDGATTGSSAA